MFIHKCVVVVAAVVMLVDFVLLAKTPIGAEWPRTLGAVYAIAAIAALVALTDMINKKLDEDPE